jgi:hypothetical protein
MEIDPDNGYTFDRAQFADLLKRLWFPESSGRETEVIRDYLVHHQVDFDRITLNYRVGQGQTPDPTHLAGVQANTVRSSKKRIDILAWSGSQPTLVEVKERVTPAALGQIKTYRQLFLEENPDVAEPRLVVVGRYSDPDTLRTLQAEGIDVYLYDAPDTGANADGSGV